MTFVCLGVMLTGLTACGGGGGGSGAESRRGGGQAGLGASDQTTQYGTNSPPSISGTPQASVRIGEEYVFAPIVSDPDGDDLAFEIENMPSWAQFDSRTGRLAGMPALGAAGSYEGIVIEVSDGIVSDSIGPFSISVVQTALGSITVSWQPPTRNEDGTYLYDLSGYRIHYGTSSGDYDHVVELDNPGLSSYVIEGLLPGTYYLAATSYTSKNVESEFSNEIVEVVN